MAQQQGEEITTAKYNLLVMVVSVVLAFVSGLFGAGMKMGAIEAKLVSVEASIPQKLQTIEAKVDASIKAQETSERHMREMVELLREGRK